ncbi:MAG: hypothetical protein GF418_10080, partial [Chitinivibrionales bacterium]|nr:hypothetical protein [Chitinivibrionales bacterium]MBD3395960.1 hypothetical protein [Chitinivibrionales bacterium]
MSWRPMPKPAPAASGDNLCRSLVVLLACFSYTPAGALPGIVVTPQEAAEFFEGRPAKLLIHQTLDFSGQTNMLFGTTGPLYVISLAEDTITKEHITDSARGAGSFIGDPMISPDGTRVAYNTVDEIHVCYATEGGPGDTVVARGFEQRWWVHPETGDEYIIYSNRHAAEGCMFDSTTSSFFDCGKTLVEGDTYIRKLVRGSTIPDGSSEVLAEGLVLHGGRSPDGRYMCGARPGEYQILVELEPTATQNAVVDIVDLRFAKDAACNSSISQDTTRSRAYLWLDRDHDTIHVEGQGDLPNPSAEFWHHQWTEWSTHADYLSSSVADCQSFVNASDHHVFVYQFSRNRWLRISHGGAGTHLWVKNGDEPRRAPVPAMFIDGNLVAPTARTHYFADRAEVTLVPRADGPIVYTLDAMVPKSSSKTYGSPLIIEEETVLSVMALAGDDSELNSTVREIAFRELCRSTFAPGASAGLVRRCFKGEFVAVPDIRTRVPDSSDCAKGIVLPRSFAGENYCVHFGGYLSIPADGVYTFFLGSDDGSALSIDGYAVVSNDGQHSFREMQGSIGLAEGLHEMGLSFFNAGGCDSLALEWTSASISREPVPRSAFFRPDSQIVARPYIVAPDTTFPESTEVAIYTTTRGASIHYTLDGSKADEKSPAYDGPFVLDRSATVCAIAVKDGRTPSARASMTLTQTGRAGALLAPEGGETYRVGDTVEIVWQAQRKDFSAAILSISLDGGLSS